MELERSKYRYLLDDKDILRWYRNAARTSELNADNQFRNLGKTCEYLGFHPKDLVEMDRKELKDTLFDLVDRMEEDGYGPGYIENSLRILRSWLGFNDIRADFNIKIRGSKHNYSKSNEVVPTPEELKLIFYSANKKERAACALMAFSGLRPMTLGSYRGADGLRVGDLPEMRINNGRVEFEVIPTKVVVREPLSKAGHQYFSFLGEEGCKILKNYLEERIREGEDLTEESPIIASHYMSHRHKCVSTINIGDMIRKPIRSAGLTIRPYDLRHYFETQMMFAESNKKLIIKDYRVFFMGHVGDISHRYSLNKYRLPEHVVEDLRDSYGRAIKYLETEQGEPLGMPLRLRKTLSYIVGFSQEEIDSLEIDSMSDEDFEELLINKIHPQQKEKENGNGNGDGGDGSQRVVDASEAEKLINSGEWVYKDAFPNGKVIIVKNN